MPVLQIIGSFNHLIHLDAGNPFMVVIRIEDTDVFEFPAGHVVFAVSGKAHAEL